MSVWFRLSKHPERRDVEIVEMFDGNRLLATFEPLPMLRGARLNSPCVAKFSVTPPAGEGRAIDAFEILFQ